MEIRLPKIILLYKNGLDSKMGKNQIKLKQSSLCIFKINSR